MGQRLPVTCSLSASPDPTPSRNPPRQVSADVAVAWAITAGWIRTVGQVTAVVTWSPVASPTAPMTLQTKGLCPCWSFHGWKWSEIHNASKPACSAALAWSTSERGVCSSQERK